MGLDVNPNVLHRKPQPMVEYVRTDLPEIISGLDFLDHFTTGLFGWIKSRHERVVFNALKRYLPKISVDNAMDYAERIAVFHPDGTGFPQQYWLDYGTDHAVLFLTVNPTESSFSQQTNVKASITMHQTYEL